jgi:hypothetical protein
VFFAEFSHFMQTDPAVSKIATLMSKSKFKAKRIKESSMSPVLPTVPSDSQLTPTLAIHLSPSHKSGTIHAWVIVLLITASTGLYLWTIDFPMVFDDYSYLINNPIFRDTTSFSYPTNFTEFVNRPAKFGLDPDYAINFVLRPVAYATFYLNQWFDEFNPRWYRAINIGIHAANALLLYGILISILRPFKDTGKLDRSSWHFIPAISALIFAVHPLAIESVTYIIQRFTSLVTLFSLLSLWLHFLSLTAKTKRGIWLLRSGSVFALLLAMQTKECSVTIPFLAILVDWLVLRNSLRNAAWRSLPLLLCTPLIPVLVLLITTAQNGGSLDFGVAFNVVNSRDQPLDHWHYIVTQITVVAHYLRLMFWPTGLNIDPEWPVYQSLWQKPVLLSLVALSTLIAATWHLFRRHQGDVRIALAFVGALWYFITISISSGLVPLPDMMAEHRSYLPSIGIFVMAAVFIDIWRTYRHQADVSRFPKPAVIAVAVAVFGLASATTLRNHVWRSNESLWEDAVAKSPGKYRTWGNLGTAYSENGKETKAVNCYRQAIKIEPEYIPGLLNLSNSCLRLNQPKEALDATNQLLNLKPDAATNPPVAMGLGLGLMGVGRLNEAAFTFRKIIESNPGNAQAYKALGMVYGQLGLLQQALEQYQIAYRLEPSDRFLPSMIAAVQSALAVNPNTTKSSNPFPLPFRLSSD